MKRNKGCSPGSEQSFSEACPPALISGDFPAFEQQTVGFHFPAVTVLEVGREEFIRKPRFMAG